MAFQAVRFSKTYLTPDETTVQSRCPQSKVEALDVGIMAIAFAPRPCHSDDPAGKGIPQIQRK
jgi:hypothetical protein